MENGITHQLPRAVVGDVPATVSFKQLDAATGEQLTIRYHMLAAAIAAQGQHRRMLDQQQHVANLLPLAQRANLLL